MHLCGCTREKEGIHEEEREEEKERGKGKEEERINAPKDFDLRQGSRRSTSGNYDLETTNGNATTRTVGCNFN